MPRPRVNWGAPSHWEGGDTSRTLLQSGQSGEGGVMARKGDKPSDIRSESERVRPRGYGSPFGSEPTGEPRASDKSLRERVLVTLQGEPEWANATIEVDARGSTIWLRGSVDTVNAKYRVEETVKRVRGVEAIENDLTIRVGEALEEFTRNADAARLRDELRRGSEDAREK